MNMEPICAGFMGFEELCTGVPQNSLREAKWPGLFFSSHKNTSFLKIPRKILNFPLCPQAGEASTGH